jgi:hypothetical protein
MIQIQNNYLNHNILNEILKTIDDKNFTWQVDSWPTLNLQHFLVKEKGKEISTYLNKVIGKILIILKADVVLEASVTIYTNRKQLNEFDPISPYLKNKNYKTFLLFLNSSDGYTKINGLEKIKTKQNTVIFMEKPLAYVNTNTTDENCRGVLSIHYT